MSQQRARARARLARSPQQPPVRARLIFRLVGGWTGMLCAALGFVVFGVNKNKTAHLACLEEALAGEDKKKGGKAPLFLNLTSKRKLPWRPKTQQAAAQAQIELRAQGRFTPSRNPTGGHIDTGAAAIGTSKDRKRFRSVLLFLDLTVVLFVGRSRRRTP